MLAAKPSFLALRNGNSTQALQLLEPTRTHGNYLLFPIAYLRGQTYLNDKKGAEAAAQFQEILDHRGWSPLSYFYPFAQLGLARAAALSGEEHATQAGPPSRFTLRRVRRSSPCAGSRAETDCWLLVSRLQTSDLRLQTFSSR